MISELYLGRGDRTVGFSLTGFSWFCANRGGMVCVHGFYLG